jgi:ABC-type molybdenum transport system ATPase subunit/photorepair protein PhrA
MTLVTAQDVAVGYGGRPVLEGLTFGLEAGERVAVLGPNGGGKSTLVRALLGELTPLAGRLEVAVRCSVVPQTERSRLDYPVTALDVALMGAYRRVAWYRRLGAREREAALGALGRVGLAAQANTAYGELSGGQRQRVALARALLIRPRLVLLDNATGSLDGITERRVVAGLRERFEAIPPLELRRRLAIVRDAALPLARRLDMATIRSDTAWGWVYSVLHGHALDHLRVIEPWAELLRARQVQNDPFGGHPQPVASAIDAGKAAFWADEAAITELFRETVFGLPDAAWTTGEPTPGWTIADHVGHLTAWFEETIAAIAEHRPGEPWRPLPAIGLDAWNAAEAARRRGTDPADLRDGFETARSRLVAVVAAMADDDWLDPEGFGWAYEDLHGHVRAHLAMIAPHAARAGWPAGPAE